MSLQQKPIRHNVVIEPLRLLLVRRQEKRLKHLERLYQILETDLLKYIIVQPNRLLPYCLEPIGSHEVTARIHQNILRDKNPLPCFFD